MLYIGWTVQVLSLKSLKFYLLLLLVCDKCLEEARTFLPPDSGVCLVQGHLDVDR